jgi:hypothetical protein
MRKYSVPEYTAIWQNTSCAARFRQRGLSFPVAQVLISNLGGRAHSGCGAASTEPADPRIWYGDFIDKGDD